MRHDSHFVDHLTHPGGTPVGRLIPVEEIDPNPNQPRQSIGDLSELAASIREKGLLEPILVRPRSGRFQIVAGERRYRAAVDVGLDELPCVVRECDDAEVIEIALIENLQRKDLTAFEEGTACGRWPTSTAIPTRSWRNGWARAAARSPRRSRWPPCPSASGRSVGWPTSALSHCCFR
jgi:hypothetical protein